MCPAAPTACVAAAEHVPKELWIFLKCPDDTDPAWHSVTGMLSGFGKVGLLKLLWRQEKNL